MKRYIGIGILWLLLTTSAASAQQQQQQQQNLQGDLERALKMQLGELTFYNLLLSEQNRRLASDVAALRAKIEELQRPLGER